MPELCNWGGGVIWCADHSFDSNFHFLHVACLPAALIRLRTLANRMVGYVFVEVCVVN